MEWSTEGALAVTAWAGANRALQVIEVIRLLDEMHGARCLTWPDIDARCKTCRDSRGRPAPWPCDTFQRFGELLGVAVAEDSVAMFRTFGQARNGSRRALGRIRSGEVVAGLAARPDLPALGVVVTLMGDTCPGVVDGNVSVVCICKTR